MAKIKSTLDLVMERTKNLNMTDADRERLRTKEETDLVRAWLQRYFDGRIDADEIRRNLDANIQTLPGIREILKRVLISHVRPEYDNTAIIHALERVFDISAQPVEELIASCRTHLDTNMHRYLEQLGSDLKRDGIYGTSVVPNVKKSRQWQEFILQSTEDLAREIIQFIDTGTSSP
jgi:hypothetical protein